MLRKSGHASLSRLPSDLRNIETPNQVRAYGFVPAGLVVSWGPQLWDHDGGNHAKYQRKTAKTIGLIIRWSQVQILAGPPQLFNQLERSLMAALGRVCPILCPTACKIGSIEV